MRILEQDLERLGHLQIWRAALVSSRETAEASPK